MKLIMKLTYEINFYQNEQRANKNIRKTPNIPIYQ